MRGRAVGLAKREAALTRRSFLYVLSGAMRVIAVAISLGLAMGTLLLFISNLLALILVGTSSRPATFRR